eukprot:14117726-Ditylum_brightwellii.AAC.1
MTDKDKELNALKQSIDRLISQLQSSSGGQATRTPTTPRNNRNTGGGRGNTRSGRGCGPG